VVVVVVIAAEEFRTCDLSGSEQSPRISMPFLFFFPSTPLLVHLLLPTFGSIRVSQTTRPPSSHLVFPSLTSFRFEMSFFPKVGATYSSIAAFKLDVLERGREFQFSTVSEFKLPELNRRLAPCYRSVSIEFRDQVFNSRYLRRFPLLEFLRHWVALQLPYLCQPQQGSPVRSNLSRQAAHLSREPAQRRC